MSEGVSVAIFTIFLWALGMFSPEFAANATRAFQAKNMRYSKRLSMGVYKLSTRKSGK
ncbi:hypothetical protein [Priestia koreensis]|uniref:hypothetical protein n=1 Tax=Priestia koreensis TaxID=284581 RepID=UPI003016DD64